MSSNRIACGFCEPPGGLGCCPSKAVVLLLLIYHLMYLPLFKGVLCLSLFFYALLCVLSSFAIIWKRKNELVALLIVLRMSCNCKYCVALPNGAVGWSAVCDCGIIGSYSLF